MAEGRNEQPSAAIFDSRTLQSTVERGHRAGYDGAKRKKGSKVRIDHDECRQKLERESETPISIASSCPGTVSGNSGALGYSAVLFDVGCSSCPNEKLFVAASAKERRIIAVELLAADQDEHGDLNEFLKQFVGKKPGDELSLGRGIELKSELINLNGAIAIADRINEFLRALSELEK